MATSFTAYIKHEPKVQIYIKRGQKDHDGKISIQELKGLFQKLKYKEPQFLIYFPLTFSHFSGILFHCIILAFYYLLIIL